MGQAVEITLPYPPSVNSYWRMVGSKVLISKPGREYRAAVQSALAAAQIEPISGPMLMVLIIHPPDRRRRDLDNVLKAIFDGCQHGGLYADDNQIKQLWAEMREPTQAVIDRGGMVRVAVHGRKELT